MQGVSFPGVSVAGVDLSGLCRPSDAAVKLNETLSYPITGKILFRNGEKAWIASPAELGMVFDPSSSAVTAYDWEEAAVSLARCPVRYARAAEESVSRL